MTRPQNNTSGSFNVYRQNEMSDLHKRKSKPQRCLSKKSHQKSSLSGKPYQIKFNDGKRINVAEWLREKLNEKKD